MVERYAATEARQASPGLVMPVAGRHLVPPGPREEPRSTPVSVRKRMAPALAKGKATQAAPASSNESTASTADRPCMSPVVQLRTSAMRTASFSLLSLAFSALVAACSGSDTSGATGSGSGGTSATGGSGGAQGYGTCADTSDCNGQSCLALSAGEDAWHTCATDTGPEMTACNNPDLDECCSSADCVGGFDGACVDGTRWYCGGVAPHEFNACVYDECQSAADCTASDHGICVPAGAFGEVRNRCVYGGCVTASDCSSRSGGACLPFFDPCKGRFGGLYCTYDDSVCRSDADCSEPGQHCVPGVDGVTACETWYPPP